jgi:hypothetical protein
MLAFQFKSIKYIGLLLGIISFLSQPILAQTAALRGESADGKSVKLIWFLKEWPKGATGFAIKKKQGNGSWENVHEGILTPEVKLNKAYANAGKNETLKSGLNTKLAKLIDNKQTKEISAADYLQKIKSDPNALKNIAYAIALDYDFALINGFACIDESASGNTSYGLFVAEKDKVSKKPLTTFDWDGKSIKEKSIQYNFELKKAGKEKGIQFIWTPTPSTQFDNILLSGFHVHKNIGGTWVKLNEKASLTFNNGVYTYTDANENLQDKSNYGISFTTSFGHEGSIVSIPFDPSLYPASYKVVSNVMVVCNAMSGDKYAKISWDFPESDKMYIKGFMVEKANLPGDFKPVSGVVGSNRNQLTDTTYSPAGSYVKYKVTALYKDQTPMPSEEQLFYFLPMVDLAQPKNLKGEQKKNGKETNIIITWDAKPSWDTLTEGYQLFASNRFDQKMYLEGSLPLIKGNTINYPVFNTYANTYKFVVVPLSKYKTNGKPSDTLKVYVPAQILPLPKIQQVKTDSTHAILKWLYPADDIKGFRVYQNGNMVASEFELKAGSNQFTSAALKPNTRYYFTLQAVSVYSVESGISVPVEVIVTGKTNK